jgi:hypothetical protein
VVAGNGAEAGKCNRSNSRSSGFPAAALSLQSLGFGVSGARLAELELTAESVTTRRFVSLDLCGSAPISTHWSSSTPPLRDSLLRLSRCLVFHRSKSLSTMQPFLYYRPGRCLPCAIFRSFLPTLDMELRDLGGSSRSTEIR